jgi:hypothetical protein
MAEINHNRPHQKMLDSIKRDQKLVGKSALESQVTEARQKYVPDFEKSRKSHGPTVLLKLLTVVEDLVETQNHEPLRELISNLEKRDARLLIEITKNIVSGINISLSRSRLIDIQKTNPVYRLKKKYYDFRNLSHQRKGFRSKVCRDLLKNN